MKIMHIGDIHLGCKYNNQTRNDEIKKVFDFLVAKVREEKVEAALLAGDVFDNGLPSSESQGLYYGFLVDLQQAGCRQIVVIAGNHDKAEFLDAPKELLGKLNIHVVGQIDKSNLAQEVIALGSKEAPSAFVCAVPQLYDGDVRGEVPEGEDSKTKAQRFTEGVAEHYRKVYAIADEQRAGRTIPIIGMGHLYALGSTFNTKNPEREVGNLEGIQLEEFGSGFDYMALGHIHKPQIIPGHDNWRYAGSILPMSVQEKMYATQVILLDTDDLSHSRGLELPDECFHKMKYIKGDMEELRAELAKLRESNDSWWVKTVYTGKEILPKWAIDLRLELRDSKVDIAETDIQRTIPQEGKAGTETTPQEEDISFETLTPEKVFLKHLAKQGLTDESKKQEYLEYFIEAEKKVLDQSQKQEVVGNRRAGLMKFKRLYIKNVNSLYGEHLIDFDSPEFNKGIFLISGPTGAGKSSILDAICLALYGKTPRVNSISNRQDSVMSEGEEEMMAELTFTLGNDTYRVAFQHARSNGKEPFGQVKHALYKNAVPQNCKPSQVADEIGRLIGMDAAQFTRCVLLAQGSFDAFLKSGARERAAILTQITGTEIYTEIGRKINEAYKAIETDYKQVEKDLNGITFLTDEELKELQEKHDKAKADLNAILVQIKKCEDIEKTFENIAQKQQEVQDAETLLKQAEKAQAEAKPRQIQLQDANRAQLCQMAYHAMKTKAGKLSEVMKELENLVNALNGLEEILKNANTEKATQEDNLAKVAQEQRDAQVLFQQVRKLDTLIRNKRTQLTAAKTNYDNAKKTRNEADNTFTIAMASWEKAQREAKESTDYLTAHAADEQLEKKQENWELRRSVLYAFEQDNFTEEKAIQKEMKKLETAEKALNTLQGKINETETQLQEEIEKIKQEQKKRDELLGGKSREDIQNAWGAASKLNDFFTGETKRSDFLQSNKPCPLCGSTQHPYCEGTPVPEDNGYDKLAAALKKTLDDIESCDASIKPLETEKERLTAVLAANQATYNAQTTQYQTNKANLEARQNSLTEALEKAKTDAQSLASELEQALQVEWTDHSALPQSLKSRINAYNEAKKKAEALEDAKNTFATAETAYNAVKDQNLQAEQQTKKVLDDLNTELEAYISERKKLLGDDKVETRENALAKKVATAQKARDNANNAATTAQVNVDNNKTRQVEKNASIQQLISELETLKKDFEKQLKDNGFSSAEDFEAKRIEEPTRIQALIDELHELDTNVQTATTTLNERRDTLKKLNQSLPPDADRTANIQELNNKNTEKDAAQKTWQEYHDLLHDDQKSRANAEAARRKKEKLEPDFKRWEYLNANFGTSESSDRFGRIAQGYTFSQLLHHANANRLTSLQRHFTLVNDEQNPLELNVIDHYRFDKVRTSRNLSGGESFEVSLALALGLADMSAISQNASLGNVLLDEGFGTLDEDSLDSALNLLMQLNGNGSKLVGIISHVAKLREKIDAKIEVTNRDGMGSISGAGVNTLAEIQCDRNAVKETEKALKKANRAKAKEEKAKQTEPEEEEKDLQ